MADDDSQQDTPVKRGPGRPPGSKNKGRPVGSKNKNPMAKALKRSYQRNLSLCIRESVSVELIRDYCLMMLQGHVPVIIADGRCEGGYRVAEDEVAMERPTIEQRNWALNFLRQGGWGLPAQSIQLEASLEAKSLTVNATISASEAAALSQDQLDQLATILAAPAALLGTGLDQDDGPDDSDPADPGVVDVEFEDLPDD